MMRSVQTRLVLGTTLGMTAVLLPAGVLLCVFVRAGLVNQLDRSLIDKAGLLASKVESCLRRVVGAADLRRFPCARRASRS